MAVATNHAPASTATDAAALPAAGSSFYLGMRVLPRPRREAMYAIYAFCRAVDDIADATGPREPRRASLDVWRSDIDALFEGKVTPTTSDLAEPVRAFDLRREDFLAVIDGMEMDIDADLRAPDWETLDLYCDRVASAVGRLSVRIFGIESGPGDKLAHHLGRALQLTNILRDLDEDAAMGRLYLPREALSGAGIKSEGRAPATVLGEPRLDIVCREVAERAQKHFVEADRIMAACPRRAVRAPRLMEAKYRQILTQLLARGWKSPRVPVKTSKLRLVGALIRHGIA
jgi:presqualene diphosphate synthase